MSQGLGIAQRRVLAELYLAESDPERHLLSGIALTADGEEIGDALEPEYRDGTVWIAGYAISRFGLVEADHPVLGDPGKSTAAQRDFKRSRRVPYRRALSTLGQRGLIQSARALIFWTPATVRRETVGWLARITEAGALYAEQHRAELAEEVPAMRYPRRDQVLPAAAAERREVRAARVRSRTSAPGRPEAAENRESTETALPAPTSEPGLLSKDDLVAHLVAEGFDTAAVSAALRGWHRRAQQQERALYGEAGPALDQREFSDEDLAELREKLAQP